MKPKNKLTSIILALFFSFFTYIYTWKKDYLKFIILGVINIIFLNILVTFIIWVGTLGMVSIRKKKWYLDYGKRN